MTTTRSRRLVDSVLSWYRPEQFRWHYEHGLLLQAVEAVYAVDKDPRLAEFIVHCLDTVVGDGIATYRADEYNLDQINPGKALFFALESGQPRFRNAIESLRGQLASQPRTASGGYWHKLIYPDQVWLDGLFMHGPFSARCVAEWGGDFGDLVHQFTLIEAQSRDPATGLLSHAWDESRNQRWADPTGRSPHFWSRALGWYGMALVDTLDWVPVTYRGHATLVGILGRWAKAVERYQHESGLWFQVIDQGHRQGNYLESSGSAMFSYALAKGVRRGWLDARHGECARAAFEGLWSTRVVTDDSGVLHLEGTCAVAGLGGDPYRDGSFEYYVGEPVRTDDLKGLGPLILAAVENEASHG